VENAGEHAWRRRRQTGGGGRRAAQAWRHGGGGRAAEAALSAWYSLRHAVDREPLNMRATYQQHRLRLRATPRATVRALVRCSFRRQRNVARARAIFSS